MLEKRGCHELVYLRETIIARSEQSNFASSLIVLLFMYKGACVRSYWAVERLRDRLSAERLMVTERP